VKEHTPQRSWSVRNLAKHWRKNTYSHTFRNVVQSNSKYKHVTRCKLDEAPPETADQGGGEGSHCPEKAEKDTNKKPQLLVAKQIYQIVQTFQ